MIARFRVLASFKLHFVDGEKPEPFDLEDENYKIVFYPPYQLQASAAQNNPDVITMDVPVRTEPIKTSTVKCAGKETYETNVFQIDLKKKKGEFDRRRDQNTQDPPQEYLEWVMKQFITRIRAITRSSFVDIDKVAILKLEYLNDDGTTIPADNRYFRTRIAAGFRNETCVITTECWKEIQKLPLDFQPPGYLLILLDAFAALPKVGTSMVLAFAALETSISFALDILAAKSSTMPTELWNWINDRNDFRKEPSVSEQFTVLLSAVGGKSLQDNEKLWQAFSDLKQARNSFVHEGKAMLGKKNRTEVNASVATDLVGKAAEIINFLEAQLPAEYQRPSFSTSELIIMGPRFAMPVLNQPAK